MKRHLMIVIALGLGLAAGGCKKDKKDDGEVGKASGTAEASGTGTGTASGTGTGTASGTAVGTGTGSGTGTGTAGAVLKIAYVPMAVGTKVHKEELEVGDLVFGDTPVKVEKTSLRHSEVLEASAFPDKVRVLYEQHHEVINAEGKTQTRPDPVEGKTFVVWKDNGAILATHEDGSPATPEEMKEVTESFDDELGRKPGIAEVFLRHEWKVGETVVLEGQDLVDLTEDMKKGANVDAAKLTLRSVDGTTAVFELELTATISGDTTGKTAAKAVLTIDTAYSRPLSIVGDQELDMVTKGKPLKGKSTSTTKFTYE